MPDNSGRKEDEIWSEVSKIENKNKVSCNYCLQEISSESVRKTMTARN